MWAPGTVTGKSESLNPGVPNLGYMSPRGTFKGSNRRENVFAYYLFPNIYTYISDFYFQKS